MMASYGDKDSRECIEKMSVLKKIEDFMLAKNSDVSLPTASELIHSNRDQRSETVPDEFQNPKPLGQIKHPGQTYASACNEKCLPSGHQIHQSTQQRTANTTSTPNYASSYSLTEHVNIDALMSKLCSPDPEEQKSAAAELRLLAKQNASNRICIAEAGAIPLLSNLLSSSDLKTQQLAVTALLNLSIHVDNKAIIISSGAVPSIVHVLMNGNMEARENAAATLYSLSVIREYNVTIGEAGAIPALVIVLSEGSQRGKKDAAAALFHLCIYEGNNKARAVRAGLVPLIMGLVTNSTGALVDEATAILPILSSHPDGKAAIGATAEHVSVLVEMISRESRRDRECAAEVMLHLCSDEKQLRHLACLQECRIMAPLRKLALNGSGRGKRKAVQLLERISRFLVEQQEEQEAKAAGA